MGKELEYILDSCAQKTMREWDLQNFKKTHPSLFQAIINAMTTVITGTTCTANERAFLDEIQTKFIYLDEEKCIIPFGLNKESTIWADELSCDIKKVINRE